MLELRPITPSEIPEALKLHQHTWGKDHALVIDYETIQRHVKNNPDFQIGAFFKGRLIGVVTTARFNESNTPQTAHYNVIRRHADPDGDTLACFIISRHIHQEDRQEIKRALEKLDLLEGVRKKTVGAAIIKKVAQVRAERNVKNLRAASTPKDLMPDGSGEPATRQEIQAHLDAGKDSVIFGLHGDLGARLLQKNHGIVPNGRPHSDHLPGRGALVWMDYGPLPITTHDAAKNVQQRLLGLKFFDRQKRTAVPALVTLMKINHDHAVSIDVPGGVGDAEFGRFLSGVHAHANKIKQESQLAGKPIHVEVSHPGLRLIHVTFKEKT